MGLLRVMPLVLLVVGGLSACDSHIAEDSLPLHDPVGYSACQSLAEALAASPAKAPTNTASAVSTIAALAGLASTADIKSAGIALAEKNSENLAFAEGDLYQACMTNGVSMPPRGRF